MSATARFARLWPYRVLLPVAVATSIVAFAPGQLAAHAAGGTATGADLQMSGSASNASPHTGDTFTLTYLVKNNGPQTATGATFLDPDAFMDTGATVNGNAAACGFITDATTFQQDMQCSLGDLASGAQVTVVENAVAGSCVCQFVLTPTVTSTVTDPNLTNNTPSITIKVQASTTTTTTGGGGGGGGGTTTTPSGADIQVSGSSNLGAPLEGQAYTYTYQVKNAGPTSASSVTFTDDLAEGRSVTNNPTPGATLVAAAVNADPTLCSSASDGAFGTLVTCTMTIAAGGQATITLNVDAPIAETGTGTYSTTGSATSTLADPNTANNATTVTIKITAGPALVAAPCATVTSATTSSIPRASTNQGASGTETMSALVTSCSSLTQTGLTFKFVAGPYVSPDGFVSFQYSWVFTCGTGPLSLSPGATVGVTCNVAYQIGPDVVVNGQGAATVYNADGTALASQTYFWAIDTSFAVQPAPPPKCPGTISCPPGA